MAPKPYTVDWLTTAGPVGQRVVYLAATDLSGQFFCWFMLADHGDWFTDFSGRLVNERAIENDLTQNTGSTKTYNGHTYCELTHYSP